METLSGCPVKIFDFQSGGDYPVLGAYYNNVEWIPCKWDEFGRFPSINANVQTSLLDIKDFVGIIPGITA